MKEFLFLLLMAPFLINAQDYTINGAGDATPIGSNGENTVIVIPLHPHYLISEADRMLTTPEMDVQQLREKLRKKCTMEITMALADSLDAIDISTGNVDGDIDILDYTYNAVDYKYVQLESTEEDQKRFQLKIPRKKEEKVYGAFTTRRDGQLDRTEILEDRYMSASFGNPGAVEYLQDIWAFEYILTITQLELKRNLDNESDKDYYISLHYEWMDNLGDKLKGGKIEEFIAVSDMDYHKVMSVTIPNLAKDLATEIWSQLYVIEPKSPDFSDY